MPPDTQEIDFVIALAHLGNYRAYLKRWLIYYQSQPETSIRVTDPRDIIQNMYVVDQAYKKLLIETGRVN